MECKVCKKAVEFLVSEVGKAAGTNAPSMLKDVCDNVMPSINDIYVWKKDKQDLLIILNLNKIFISHTAMAVC